ncbi:MAG TPA: TRAP transporter TatT component family protein [Bacteriovoracaceae bacterium]|nr:TRAP transporter TatT component family protein [Bacteriovoracaceae bacterium]
MNLIMLLLLLSGVGCSSIQKWTLRSASPVFQRSTTALTKENNWEFFKESLPANLKFIELLWQQDPENLALLSILVKGYAGYAFAVPETINFGDELSGLEDSSAKKEAIVFYTRSLDYGLLYLSKKGIQSSDLLALDAGKLLKKLSRKLKKEDLVPLMYTAQSWGSLINLQKDNVALVSQVPRVKLLFDHVCGKAPAIEQNSCEIFNAQYEAARPKMLGGNPEKAQELYRKAITDHPQHLIIRLGYIQYLLLPSMDGEKYEKEAAVLREEFAKWSDINRDGLENKSEYKGSSDLNLYNAIAKKRFEMIEKNKNKIF